jgi:hypothetical protein
MNLGEVIISLTYGIHLSKFFSAVDFEGSQIFESSKEIHEGEKFDFIIGALPFGMNQIDVEYHGAKLRIPRNWNEIFQSLEFLENSGTGLYLLEPLGFGTSTLLTWIFYN